jgi:alkanesulfonate monooxygenase SsuD/methylene tetrahydromethanopterin reductase-like flavin-dependent oxidoreductase (luciferase family)
MPIQTKQFTGEIGIHYPLHVLNRYSLPELIGLAEHAWQTLGRFGFSQVWTNDNLEYRSVLASSAAIVARVPVKLGTAVTVPYFRNPVDLAMAFATISELTNGREISLGLGPGSRSILAHQVERVKPLTIMAELATALRQLFAGEALRRADIPALASYFHLNANNTRCASKLVADPSLLWSKPPQARGARAHSPPFRRRDSANSLWDCGHECVVSASAIGTIAIPVARAVAQSDAA